ncbi:MAG TPA: efflux transporter outer membrane subunit [Steroidobacteraceae bacterium]|nr:efflux transporter outer membrane subunit [Steroidobacteraceae bacterium]
MRAALALMLPAALGAVLAACTLAPRYQPPPTLAVARFKEAGDWLPARPADTVPRGTWWGVFHDATLDELEGRLTQENPSVRAAVGRLDQALAIALQARSSTLPTVGADASATRERVSANAPLAGVFGNKSVTYNDFMGELQFSWEIDVFGRLRSALAAARAEAQASAGDLAAVTLTLQAQLATDYFSLRGDDADMTLLEDTVRDYDRAYELTHNRYDEGIAAATDVDQADTLRQSARAQLAAVRLQRAELEHAIAVLVGEAPSDFSLAAGPLAAAPPRIDPGLPSTLLERRPDVASAERAVAAANAEIGVARAAWFPVFSLSSAAGFESTVASSWFKAPSELWSVGPGVELPLLDAGARLAQNRAAWAEYRQAVASYRGITLTAYQEVEDNLAALHHLADELAADQAAARSALSSAHHADERYVAGVADYVEVTTTHTAALQAQRDALGVRVLELNAAVALVRATGGGWSREQLDPPAAAVAAAARSEP